MRLMSFALTTDQILSRTKTVTRRLGWLFLEPGHLVQPVVKARGLRKGERPVKLGGPIRIVSVRREPLSALLADRDYGLAEVRLEGFADRPPLHEPEAWVAFFARTHRCGIDDVVTRIEFEYVR